MREVVIHLVLFVCLFTGTRKPKKRKEKASISIYCHFLVPLSFVRVLAMKFDTNLVVAKPWSKLLHLFLGVGVGQAAASDALRLRRPEEVMHHHLFTFCFLLLLGLERTWKCETVKQEWNPSRMSLYVIRWPFGDNIQTHNVLQQINQLQLAQILGLVELWILKWIPQDSSAPG